MLPSNGHKVKQHFNYHITLKEFMQILQFARERFDPKWPLFMLTQMALGLRCSEVAAINIYDFKADFNALDVRLCKTNDIKTFPVPPSLRHEIMAYITLNKHRMKDGFLFAAQRNTSKRHTAQTVGAYWCKLRQGLAKRYNDSKWLDITPAGRHRISSHSLRRLHRTIIGRELNKQGYTDYVIAKLCNYKNVNTFMIYRNEFELEEQKAEILNPVIEPIIRGFQNIAHDQTRLLDYA